MLPSIGKCRLAETSAFQSSPLNILNRFCQNLVGKDTYLINGGNIVFCFSIPYFCWHRLTTMSIRYEMYVALLYQSIIIKDRSAQLINGMLFVTEH